MSSLMFRAARRRLLDCISLVGLAVVIGCSISAFGQAAIAISGLPA